MPIDKEFVGQVIDQSGGVLEKAYDDLAHPTAKSVGNTVSLIPRTIGVWLGKWEKWVINGEESIRLTAEAVREKAAKIPEEKLTEPEPYVAIPAVQQLSYCYDSEELREMYANLLVSSMNTDTKQAVHPSFVDIIKQLTPDEARLLSYINSQKSKQIAIIDVYLAMTGEIHGNSTVMRAFSGKYYDLLQLPDNYPVYIDNLLRLNLCSIPGTYILDDALYDEVLHHKAFTAKPYAHLIPQGKMKVSNKDATVTVNIKKLSLDLTDLGKQFCDICMN